MLLQHGVGRVSIDEVRVADEGLERLAQLIAVMCIVHDDQRLRDLSERRTAHRQR